MAKRQSNADLLSGKVKPAGWQDQLAGEPDPEPTTPPRFKRKTYLMTEELIERVEAFAERHGVGINEALRFALIAGMNAIDAGQVEVKPTIVKRTLGV